MKTENVHHQNANSTKSHIRNHQTTNCDCCKEMMHRTFTRWKVSVSLLCSIVILFLPGVIANRPPHFVLNGQSEIVLRLKEGPDTPVGSKIYRLRGIDPDGDPLTFGVREPGNEILRIENLGADEANVYLRRELDREEQDEYALILTLTDGRLGDGVSVTQSLLLLVEDVNDNSPVFKPFQATVSVKENSHPTVLTTVEAVDRDEGAYGQVVYRFQDTDGDDNTFAISSVNGKGVVRVLRELDFERKSVYQLRVLAVDRANTGKINTATAAILVQVQDEEDQPPEFIIVPPVTRVPEDISVGSPILHVKAVDGDRGVNNNVSYAIIEGPLDLFAIDARSGIVYCRQRLDRESVASNSGAYILQIMATEDSKVTPQPTTTTEVTIILMDVNDETPTFRSVAYEAEINENSQVNLPVTFLGDVIPEVYDHDQGKNGTFRLYLHGDGGVFEVTPSLGVNEVSFLIRVKDPSRLDYEKVKALKFAVIAEELVENNRKLSSASVLVHVRDVNDNFPEFNEAHYEASIPEDAKKGATIAWIQAMDADSGNFGSSGIRYTGLSGSLANKLTLNPETGVITVRTDRHGIDREQVALYFLTVEARDDLGKGNRNTVQLTVYIEDVNDNAPVFLQREYEVRLFENEANFATPIKVEARDADLNGTQNSRVTYSIVAGDPRHNFTINPETGELAPAAPLDFETLPGLGNVRAVNLTIQAQDMGQSPQFSLVSVVIYVQDVNDHSPKYEREFYFKSIPENTAGGREVIQVRATDEDGSSPNNLIVYRIQTGARDKFVIDPDSGMISIAHGANLDPDRTEPKTTTYTLEVVALDGGIGRDQRRTVVYVNISIQDVNNKVPMFLDPGTVSVLESVPVGHYVNQVRAFDADDRPILRYILDHTNSEARNEEGTRLRNADFNFTASFELNAVDGVIRVARPLDREKVETFRLALKVEDLASVTGRQTATTTLTIVVNDVNDNDPQFRKPIYRRSIPENSKNGAPIANIVADDADINRTITYSLEGSGPVIDLVHLDPVTGEVVVATKVDRELFPWLNFTVRATDSGIPPRSNLVAVIVQVVDENDNNPFFIDKIVNVSVREDTPIGTPVATLEAKDADTGDYGKVTYLLDRKSSKGKFTIDPDTGLVTVADTLDREQQSNYNLIIEAWDNFQFGYASGESRNAFKQMGVTVVDVNDEAPVLEIVDKCASVSEFHELRDIITTVRATDADDPKTLNAHIAFTIKEGNDGGLFRIESASATSARILPARPLKGHYGNYTITIQAMDEGFPPNAVTSNMSICVTDFNDNAPVFVSPSQNYTIRLFENATIGYPVIQVRAVDGDVGPNGVVRYRLRHDPLGQYHTFSMDEKTGVISVNQPLDREKQKIYEIRVEAFDLGTPTPLSNDLDLTIYIRNINDFEPHFLVDEFTVNFTEHTAAGSERRRLSDTEDRDELDDGEQVGPVCYFLVGGNEDGHFELDRVKHELYVVKELDREIKDTHLILVKATEDCLKPPRNTSFFNPNDDTLLKVIVYVNDINDNAPRFLKRVFTGGVTTETDFGTEVMKIRAIDLDIGEHADLRYYQTGQIRQTLAEGLDNIRRAPFIVEHKTGRVLLNFDPQRGMKGYFDFLVLANDTDGLADQARVFIYLLRKDQRIKFVLRLHPAEVRERIEIFRDVLGNVTGAIVNVDEYKLHENEEGTIDKTKTDLYLHFVNRIDHSIAEVNEVLSLVDKNIEQLDSLFKEFNVLDTQPAESSELRTDTEGLLLMWLLGVCVFLSILLLLVMALCLAQRHRYQRKLKAATVSAFGSHDSTLNRMAGQVPNTNIHSVEGSNPIWLHSYENEWYKEEDSLSRNSESRDSLDENAIVSDSTSPQSLHSAMCSQTDAYNEEYTQSTRDVRSPSSVRLSSPDDPDQNDLNRIDGTSTFHHNLYQHLDKLTNPLVAKKLETTEL